MTRLALLLVLLSGCAVSPTLAEPLAAPADLNAALFRQTVDIVLHDATRHVDARAVLVGPDSVRFVAAGAAPSDVMALALSDVAEISIPAASTTDIGILPGLLAGAVLVALANSITPDAGIANARAGLAVVTVGGVVGWRAGVSRGAGPPRILYRSDSNP